ncbi:MAG: response regulator [Thermoflexales bacterium]|nr:response regulator [Thermoflexales bacterium]
MINTGTLLIVDDTPVGRDALAGLLFDQGYDVHQAETGPQALDLARDINPDVILLDVMMPGMDGFEVCQRLRADPRTAQIPVLLITALDDRDSRLRGIEVGADDFISKPYDRLELRARVRTITQLNRSRRLLLEQAQFEWVVTHAQDGYLIVDHHDRILYANEQARRQLDLSIERSTPPGSVTFLSAARQYRPEPIAHWANWPLTTEPQHPRYLVRSETPGRSAVWLEVKVFDQAVSLDGRRIIRLCDVTRQIAQWRSAHTFHHAISPRHHTPLFNLLGPLSVLAHELHQLPPAILAVAPPEDQTNLEQLRINIDAALKIVNSLSMAHSVEGVTWRLLPALVRQLSEALHFASITVSLADEVGDLPIAISDTALEWVLGELFENARKFHPTHNPHLTVTVTRPEPNAVTVQVMDDGLTLSPEQLAQAWEPYFQGGDPATGEAGGMGLGLSLVASLVWEANGTCQLVNRADGPGVVVQITLPVVD